MTRNPEFDVPEQPVITVEQLLIEAEEAAAFFGGDDYILGRNDSAIGPYRHKEPGTLNWTKILFNADRFRNIDTNRYEHLEYELEFESAAELDDDSIPDGLLSYAVGLMDEYGQEFAPEDMKVMMMVETAFEVDSDGDFSFGSEVYYDIAGHEIIVVEGNGFAERYHPTSKPEDDTNQEQSEKDKKAFETLMHEVEDGVTQQQLQAARRLIEFLVQANMPNKSKRKTRDNR